MVYARERLECSPMAFGTWPAQLGGAYDRSSVNRRLAGDAVTVVARQGSVDAQRFVRTIGVTLIAATLAMPGCYPDDITD